MIKKLKPIHKKKQEIMAMNPVSEEKVEVKNEYNADDLVCARLLTVSSAIEDIKEDYGPRYTETELFYIFKKEEILENDEVTFSYEEVFTKYKFSDESSYFNVPYLIDIESYTNIFQEDKGKTLPVTMLLLKLDKLNVEKHKTNNNEKVKSYTE